MIGAQFPASAPPVHECSAPRVEATRGGHLLDGWVLANHILVSFHAAFISSVLSLPSLAISKSEVLRFIFLSPETLVSAAFVYISFHVAISIHEIGHFLTAARLNALNESIAAEVKSHLELSGPARWFYFAKLFVLAPWGRATGITREGLNYYPDAPYNLAVAAAGPAASRNLAMAALPPAVLLLGLGLWASAIPAVYVGRLLLGVGIVSLLDFLIADRGKYREFRERESKARAAAAALQPEAGWFARVTEVKQRLLTQRMQLAMHPGLGPVTAPWQFRNCGMGGRHTEKEYPESNISMQEAMFLILGARDYLDAQEMTVTLQTRLKEIIENAEGCRVMGIGLEGGLAPYIDRGAYPLPEVRLWVMMKQAIEECGYRPGEDVAIALDPAMSELEIAYREEFGVHDSVGMYLFWRDKSKHVMDRDAVLELFDRALREFEIPVLSIEDGFSEDDHAGWKQLRESQGDRLLIIGDDLITTNDATIEDAADRGLVNCALIKANQIGTLHETVLAMLVALSKGLSLVISHRSKSPNDDMEAHIALATNALGLKAGGGANTERLIKYHSVATQMDRLDRGAVRSRAVRGSAVVVDLFAAEEPTNAGVPTVGVEVDVAISGGDVQLAFRGATPLGTSAGTGEAVHLVDGVFEGADHAEIVAAHRALLEEVEPGVFAFRADVTAAQARDTGDDGLIELLARARRYQGKGCLNAVDNVREVIAPYFRGRDLANGSFLDFDRALLQLEQKTARRRNKLAGDASADEIVAVMQRKQNLGMNAVLSVSLAIARGIAHVRGKQLWELLREEMLGIIERLADTRGVRISSSRWEDYLVALREVAQQLQAAGEPLYTVLRQLTGVYEDPQLAPPSSLPPSPAHGAEETRANGDREASPAATSEAASPPPGPPPAAALPPASLPPELHAALRDVSTFLQRSYAMAEDRDERRRALRQYIRFRDEAMRSVRPFEIANDKIVRSEGSIVVPYLVGDHLLIHWVHDDELVESCRPLPSGTILTDALLSEMTGVTGEVIDLEDELYGYNVDAMPDVRVSRIRDMTALLEKLVASANYYESAITLRSLVMRLCGPSFDGLLGAKNLRPEVRQLNSQIIHLLNGPFSERLRLPMRVLVRNISSLLLRPNLIDQVWNDAIELSEIQIRGSRIATELRRSSHHALGRRTLNLASAYQDYLQTGSMEALAAVGFDSVSATDEAARGHEDPRLLVERIVTNLETLLGSSQIETRIREWQEAYAEALMRCEFGKGLDQELESIVTGGIRAGNRWVFRHHLRILSRKLEEVADLVADPSLASQLTALEDADPGDASFDAERVEQAIRAIVNRIGSELRARCQNPLFESLEGVLSSSAAEAHLDTVRQLARLRSHIGEAIETGGFPEQRYMLYQLDCLLEEMGYLAVRHIASGYEKDGLSLEECFELVETSVGNLVHDGLPSDELTEFASMLNSPGRTDAELLNVLDALLDTYHRVLHRTSLSYEALGERLELSADPLRVVLANLQRYMHDLNTVAHLADLAKSHLRTRADTSLASAEPGAGRALQPFDILHLSHRADIAARMDGPAPCLRDHFGGKGSGLIRISHAGLPTRDGFILPTDLARSGAHQRDTVRFETEIARHLEILENDLGQRESAVHFGDPRRPLLLAVRGGSIFSMPGILSTIVFVGINDEIAAALAAEDPWYAYDTYRRFLTSWGSAVMGVDLEHFDLVEAAKREHGTRYKNDLPWQALRDIAERCKELLREKGQAEVLDAALEHPRSQLSTAIRAVLASWNTLRARRFREIKGLSDSWNTAVIIQQMASGNRRNDEICEGMNEARASLTGVIPRSMMTRIGLPQLTGDIKFSASGDDLVGGLTAADSFRPIESLRSLMPTLERRIDHAGTRIRISRGTDVELEFTVERGVLSILQARTASTTLQEEVRSFEEPGEPVATGIGIRGGAFRGRVAFDEAGVLALAGAKSSESDGVLLLLENPTPDEIPMILSADGLLAARGGSTSHAAVAVHGIEARPFSAVLGALTLRVESDQGFAHLVGTEGQELARIEPGDVVSIDGRTGEVWIGSRSLLAVPPKDVLS